MTDALLPALPRIGIRLSGGLAAGQCLELARAAEEAGFASVWFAENPFQRGVIPTAGACAAATNRVRLGVGVVNPFGRHPAQIAMDFAALAELAEGRIVLGIGSGIRAAIRRMGFADDRPITAVREAVAIIRGMLSGETVSYSGFVYRIDGARLGFTAGRRALPIYVAAAGEPGLRACGEIADGLIVSNLTPSRTTERLVSIVTHSATNAGRRRLTIVQYVPCVTRADGDAARLAARTAIAEMLTAFWPESDDAWPRSKEAIVEESGIPRGQFAAALQRLRRGDDAAVALDDRFIAAFAIAGTAAECLCQAARYSAAGVDELALTFAGPQPMADIAYLGHALAKVEWRKA